MEQTRPSLKARLALLWAHPRRAQVVTALVVLNEVRGVVTVLHLGKDLLHVF